MIVSGIIRIQTQFANKRRLRYFVCGFQISFSCIRNLRYNSYTKSVFIRINAMSEYEYFETVATKVDEIRDKTIQGVTK